MSGVRAFLISLSNETRPHVPSMLGLAVARRGGHRAQIGPPAIHGLGGRCPVVTEVAGPERALAGQRHPALSQRRYTATT